MMQSTKPWLTSRISRLANRNRGFTPPGQTFQAPSIPELLRSRTLKDRHEQKRVADGHNPLASLYRMYEYIVLDYNAGLRSEIEYFFNHADWTVAEIPDPRDPDPARYAILSVLPRYMVGAFNRLIEKGLPRDAPAIISSELEEELGKREKILEKVPSWTESVPRLKERLTITDIEGAPAIEGESASCFFLEKNLLVFEPHVFFV